MNIAQKMLLTCCGVIAVSACKKNKLAPDNYISFYANDVYNIEKPNFASIDDGTFIIDGGPDSKDEIGLFIDTEIQVKTYHFENEADNAVGDYYNRQGTHFWSDTGVLVISTFDGKHVSGTFSFKGHPLNGNPATVNITEGHFSAEVTYDSFSTDTCTVCDSAYSFSHRAGLASRYLRRKQFLIKTKVR